nr:unnamed protein product [Callosobruchus analis]
MRNLGTLIRRPRSCWYPVSRRRPARARPLPAGAGFRPGPAFQEAERSVLAAPPPPVPLGRSAASLVGP